MTFPQYLASVAQLGTLCGNDHPACFWRDLDWPKLAKVSKLRKDLCDVEKKIQANCLVEIFY